ncbi:MAG: hypothetical protein M1388_01285 [Thaumarchaeota archaeon]|nr:hypothetical protein [Nitrososphaerota archaeon]
MARRRFAHKEIGKVRKGPGVYKLYAKNAKKPTYIGSSDNIRRRLIEHEGSRYYTFNVFHTKTVEQAKEKEKRMIRINKPRRNKTYIP